MKPSRDIEAIALALQARHGLDVRGTLALRARLEQAVLELPESAGPPQQDEAFLDALAQRLRVGETRFYRDPEQSDALARDVIPRALATGRCRILSAGCSTGQEAYTLAMLVAARDPDPAVVWDVTGIDVSASSVEVARRARYPREVAGLLPAELRRFVLERSHQEIEVAPEVAARCNFAPGDLLTTPLNGPFHLVLCRNVLIYLSDEAAQRLLDRLALNLTRGGVLVVARAEVQLARRAGLDAIEVGSPPIVAFTRKNIRTPDTLEGIGPAPASRAPPSSMPPSSVRLSITLGDDPADIVARGQKLLARGAAHIEIHLAADGHDARLAALAPAIRRFVAAAQAVGARCVAGNKLSARALQAIGVPID